ncbi:MAG: hypothetical protein JWM83_2285 [Candidatus Angelobacter sp.]|nr:hypothetical protein [Candidatus Angelobacter sp.]
MYVVILLVLLAAAGAMRYYYAEISALAWHARHGFHAELRGIRVQIPLPYEADDSAGMPTLLITRYAGHLWHGGGVISIDFGKQPSIEAMQAAEAMLLKGSVGVKRTKVGERTAVFAGRQGTCLEFIPEIDNSLINKLIRERDIRDIDCRFGGDLSVRFMGSANLKSDFYNVIQTAESVKGTK